MIPTAAEPQRLSFVGGWVGALAPFALFLTGVVSLGLLGTPDERGFWPILIAAIGLGLLLARDRDAYAAALVHGMSRPLVALMVLSWLLAGVLAALMRASGFVDALIDAAGTLGVTGGAYTAAAFLIAAAVSTATGTSLGTLLVCVPLLYPAGGPLGAAPAVLLGALLGGATFGDNVSPVSDTTIASAATQEAAMGDVVRSRLRYALPAAAVALGVALVWGGRGPDTVAAGSSAPEPTALAMLAAPVVVIVLLLRGRHLFVGLLAGVALAAGLGLVLGRFAPNDLMYLDRDAFIARGLVLEGLERGIGVSIFTILLMGLTAGLEASGLVERTVAFAERRSRGPRSAEMWIFTAVSAAVLLTTHASVAILTVGGFARDAGRRFDIGPARRANLLDVTVCTYPFLLPWFIPTILAAATTASDTDAGMPKLSAWTAGLYNAHSWALLVLVVVAVVTGWGRRRG